MLDTRQEDGETIPKSSKYKAYKGGITRVKRQGILALLWAYSMKILTQSKPLCKNCYQTSSSTIASADHITSKAY